MGKTIFFRGFIVTACMFAVCFIVFGVAMIVMGGTFLVRERQQSLYASASEVKLLAEAMNQQGELSSLELRMSLTVISRCNGQHIFLCDGRGVVVTSSETTRISPYIGARLDEEVMRELRRTGEYSSVGTLGGFYEKDHYIVAESIEAGNGRREGYVFVTYETGGTLTVWSGFMSAFIVMAVGVLALAVCFQYFYARRLSRPLQEMAVAADSFAQGDYSVRISPYGEDNEISTLRDAFNAMAESLEQNETRRRDLIANVSHELRTPMTSIAGFAEGILDGTIPPSEERRYLQIICSETNRLSRLVRSMLDMSRLREPDAIRSERFDLGEMVLRTAVTFEEQVSRKRLQMKLDMPEDKIFVLGDMDALTRVVYNLMDNAVKFASEETEVCVNIWKENGKAYACVQNVGETIPRSELPLIFDRFHKSDRSRSQDRDGVGLGLHMVRAIIAAHKQDIFVTSENGVTAFTFTMALAED